MSEATVKTIILASWLPLGLLVAYLCARWGIRTGNWDTDSKSGHGDIVSMAAAVVMFWPVVLVCVAGWRLSRWLVDMATRHEGRR